MNQFHYKMYCDSLVKYHRRKTRAVKVGTKTIGGEAPILLQSMTTEDTMNLQGTLEQSIRMIDAGCELVRITAPSKKEAEYLDVIKDALRSKGYDTPLVADIHFTPNAAEIAARIVEKVRVNPGNYADKKKFEELEYTDESYKAELERIEEKFAPLVNICKEEDIAMRIGTNHGSLSDRILGRYGDTPLGMVESAMEFIRICRKNDFHNIVLSMKASNTLVMVQAYRLLVEHMIREEMDYPLHLGVTEAGDGEDGRIKSAVGIGTLLEDGLGDTIRVSLTEEPEAEIPVARKLAHRYRDRVGHNSIQKIEDNPIDPYNYQRRESGTVLNIGGKHVPVVLANLSKEIELKPSNFFPFGYNYSVPLDKWNFREQAVDFIYIGQHQIDFEKPTTLGLIQDINTWKASKHREGFYPLLNFGSKEHEAFEEDVPFFLSIKASEIIANQKTLSYLKNTPNLVLVLETDNAHGMAEQRRAIIDLMLFMVSCPLVIKRSYHHLDEESFQLFSSTDLGGLLIDGLGDGIWIDANDCCSKQQLVSTAFGILQATRTRISKTEYISCPSCGRTLFDLQETTAKIRNETAHLKGVKIGIMGCIVNGPGEMADADYGYVGTGPGKITLYREKEVVRRNVPENEAVEALIDLIREHGDWIEAPALEH
ncbi:MAG: 4-hydroxy-3-methylbut-2-en-1-yl diphosphate synthase [Verrucomicrobia bacterium]|nr:4-hydroxy-3-methylbut-2-en-1-yl diphosphate synthase [Verrucomicrobiota bacterium]